PPRGTAGPPRGCRGLADPSQSQDGRQMDALCARDLASARSGRAACARIALNRPIGPHRRFAWFSVDLRDVKAVKNQVGATVNDVVLATVAGALRRFLMRRDPDGRLSDLRVLIPVTTRTATESSAMGNHVAACLMHLPIGEPQPLRRLARIRTTTAALRGANDVLRSEERR